MPTTHFTKVTVPSLNSVRILNHNIKRIGWTIINRSLVANQIFIGFDVALFASGLPYANSITLDMKDSVKLLKEDGDDCTQEVWAIGFALGYIDLIETIGD